MTPSRKRRGTWVRIPELENPPRKYTWRRFLLFLVIAAGVAAAGVCIRMAENEELGGSDNIASMWVFVCAGLCVYYALIVLYQIGRSRMRVGEKVSPSAGESSAKGMGC